MFLPEGIIIPVITPVDAQGKFNEPVYRQLIDFWADHGIDGVFPFGTTGEFYAFDNEVYRHVLEVTKDAVRGRMAVYAGANHITTAGAVELAKIAEEVGVDALSVLTPMFVSQTQDELLAYYTTIANATSLPIIIYNNKPKTNVTVAPETVRKLAQIKNIVGVKDSTGDMTNTEEYIRLTRDLPDFRVLVGRDTLIYAGLCYGAAGAITSCANIAPDLAVAIYNCYKAGDQAGALDAQFKFSKLRISTNMGTFPVVIKEGLRMMGYDVGDCIAPIAPLSEDKRAELREVLTSIGVLA
mgnify:FL=1